MKELRYKKLHDMLKEGIQLGKYSIGSLLPSENELCKTYTITRTTVRKALDELQKEGFIDRVHGKGSIVKERRNSLGLLNVKGFSEAVGQHVDTKFISKPCIGKWETKTPFPISETELASECLSFERLRSVKGVPVMIESNHMASLYVTRLEAISFVDASFFKTLSRKYLIEITGSEQELRALLATKNEARLLKIPENSPVLHIHIRFSTSTPGFFIYSSLVCNTALYPIGNAFYKF